MGDLIRPGGLGLCKRLGAGERWAHSLESLVLFLFYSCGAPREAERNTEGRVIRRLSGLGWEEVRDAEGGRRAPSNPLVGHQPDVETIWKRWAGGGQGNGEEDGTCGGWLGRAEEAGKEGGSPRSPAQGCHQSEKWGALARRPLSWLVCQDHSDCQASLLPALPASSAVSFHPDLQPTGHPYPELAPMSALLFHTLKFTAAK